MEKRYPGAFHPELRYLTVGSRAVSSAGGLRLPSCGESLGRTLALASYLPLCGQGDTDGDGITPICCAHLDGAEQREVRRTHGARTPHRAAAHSWPACQTCLHYPETPAAAPDARQNPPCTNLVAFARFRQVLPTPRRRALVPPQVEAFHIAFVPGLGTRLLGTPWYGSPQLVARWADFLK